MRTPRRSPLLLGAGLLGAAVLASVAGRPAAARPLAARPAPAAGAQPAQPAQPAARPTLVVLITVDQLRGDYHDRFRSQLTGGLARLYRGAAFVNAHHDHAITETAPGHASPFSGRHPRSTGITRNAFGVADPQAPVLGAPRQPGASPFRFRGTSLVDWMRLHDPRTRALSVSRKDRGAILPLGRAKQRVLWWGNDGRFTTSTYYADTLPSWVNAFNARGAAERLAGGSWTLLLPDSAYAEPDSVPTESAGELFTFPHEIPGDATAAAEALAGFPVMDSLTADLALAGLQAESLGTGPATDLLAVSFSTTDAVGHRFGPDSRELHDQILRLDRILGRFLDSLYTLRDSSRVLIALTGDHGVAPLPGSRSRDPNQDAQRVDVLPLLAAMDSALQRRGLPPRSIAFAEGGVQVEREAMRRAGIPVDSVLDAFAAAARRIPGVQRVDRWDRLSRADTTRDVIARRWLHMFPPELAPDMVVTITPYSAMGRGAYFQHGAPHDYDTHVPLLFYGPAFRPGRHDRAVRTVDLAPTLAAVLGIVPLERLDGVVLREAIR
jgi:hypothetical protein